MILKSLLSRLREAVVSRDNVHDGLATAALGEEHFTVNQSENRMIAAQTGVFTGLVFRAALTNQNIASENDFPAKALNAEALPR